MALTLVNERGDPQPHPDIVRRIRQIHEDLSLKYMDGDWCVMYRWSPTDTRRALIRTGEVSPDDDYDLCARLPRDCSPDEAYAFIEKHFVRRRGRNADMAMLCDRVNKYNDDVSKAHKTDLLDYADELITANKAGVVESFGKKAVKPVYLNEGEFSGKKRRKKGREL